MKTPIQAVTSPGKSLAYSIISADKSVTFSIHQMPRAVSKDWWVKK